MIDLLLICALLICGVLIALLALANMTLDARLDVLYGAIKKLEESRQRLDAELIAHRKFDHHREAMAKRTEGQ